MTAYGAGAALSPALAGLAALGVAPGLVVVSGRLRGGGRVQQVDQALTRQPELDGRCLIASIPVDAVTAPD